MGCYDTVKIKCPYCKKTAYSQTKLLGDCTLENISIGDSINSEYNGIFELKSKCECGNPLRIIIRGGKIVGSTKDDPDFIEELFGEIK